MLRSNIAVQVTTQVGQLFQDLSIDFPGADRLQQAADGGYVASAQAGLEEAQKRASQEKAKAVRRPVPKACTAHGLLEGCTHRAPRARMHSLRARAASRCSCLAAP